MANAIPCPNPICVHQFNAAELQTAVQVVCPKCGFRMQGKAKAAAAPVKSAPAAPKLTAAKPAAAPVVATAPPKPAPSAKPTTTAKTPCPNPTCTHQFTTADLQAAQVVCPKCGFRMQGKGKPAPITMQIAPPQPAPPTMKIAVPPDAPLATPIMGAAVDEDVHVAETVSTQVAVGEPVLAAPVNDNPLFDPNAGALIRAPKPKTKFRWLRLLIMLFAFGFAVCIMIVAVGIVVFMLKGRAGLGGGGGDDGDESPHIGHIRDAKGGQEKVFQLNLNRKEWAPDTEIGPKYGTTYAWKNTKLDVWFALVVKDFGAHRPRDADMLSYSVDKLKGHFESLELGEKAEGVKAGNIAMQRLQFRGQLTASTWLGECYMFFNNGIAYWLFVCSPDPERVEEFATLFTQKNLTVLSDRRGWREQPIPTETFQSSSMKIAVTVPKDPKGDRTWEKHNAKDEDEAGELLLLGKYLKEKDNRKNALLLIFTHDKKENSKEALKAVREYLDRKLKNENANYKLALAGEVKGDSDDGRLEDVGDRRGQVIDLKLQIGEEAKRYVLLAVINEPDIAYAVMCSCPWENRQIWRQELLEVLRTLRVKKE